ncbi:hypothetical protein ATE80_16550 [Streptomyces kanasensis]|uniref:Uncharacterized protein n=1 Tax=Streptomyces kanasensis TaxID=936756 RepID=A0A100Y503_9ACTN|nr:hypothetical protein ATE80_16550 [Streptomyces kanasensis]
MAPTERPGAAARRAAAGEAAAGEVDDLPKRGGRSTKQALVSAGTPTLAQVETWPRTTCRP